MRPEFKVTLTVNNGEVLQTWTLGEYDNKGNRNGLGDPLGDVGEVCDEMKDEVRKALALVDPALYCRCGVRVDECKIGCSLHPCCGGYKREGHMTDCAMWL